jgi:hypothetical protein
MVNAEHTERENIDRYNDNNHAILRLTDLAIRAVKDQCRLDVVRHELQAVFPLAPSRATSPGRSRITRACTTRICRFICEREV